MKHRLAGINEELDSETLKVLGDPDEMVSVLSVIANDKFRDVAGLAGKLAGVTHGHNGLGALAKYHVREEIAEIAAELGELIEEAVENYIEHY
jgi:hypothetical protein